MAYEKKTNLLKDQYELSEKNISCHYGEMKPKDFNSIKKIGYLIRFHRRQLGLSQTEMADGLNISFRSLQRLEMGEVEPKLETLHRVSSYLKISLLSLLRPTNAEILSMKDLSSINEFKDSHLILDTQFLQKLIQQDKIEMPHDKSNLHAKLDGYQVELSDDLGDLIGINRRIDNIDHHVAFGSSLERWEFAFRAKWNQAIIQNYYFFPKGFKVFEEFHYNLKANPEAPTSECFIRDVTHRHELESCLKMELSGGLK